VRLTYPVRGAFPGHVGKALKFAGECSICTKMSDLSNDVDVIAERLRKFELSSDKNMASAFATNDPLALGLPVRSVEELMDIDPTMDNYDGGRKSGAPYLDADSLETVAGDEHSITDDELDISDACRTRQPLSPTPIPLCLAATNSPGKFSDGSASRSGSQVLRAIIVALRLDIIATIASFVAQMPLFTCATAAWLLRGLLSLMPLRATLVAGDGWRCSPVRKRRSRLPQHSTVLLRVRGGVCAVRLVGFVRVLLVMVCILILIIQTATNICSIGSNPLSILLSSFQPETNVVLILSRFRTDRLRPALSTLNSMRCGWSKGEQQCVYAIFYDIWQRLHARLQGTLQFCFERPRRVRRLLFDGQVLGEDGQ
jgi:hypothetical protein